MESDDVMWTVSFTTLIFSLHLVNNLTVKSLKAKPMGKQTIFDSALIDTFFAIKLYGTLACLICISARFEVIRNIFIQNSLCLTILCSIHTLSFTWMCVSSGCLCIIRTLCILNLTFMEETVGETKVRHISNALVISTGITFVVIFNVTGDVNSGSSAVLVTLKMVSSGNCYYICFLVSLHGAKTVCLKLQQAELYGFVDNRNYQLME